MDRFSQDMTSTDMIALLALVVSLISFWLSYRSTRLSRLLSTAEKKYQAYDLTIETLLHGQILHSTLLKAQGQARAISVLPAENEEVEILRAKVFQFLDEGIADHHGLLKRVEEWSEWLNSKNIDDPVFFERQRAFANEIGLRMKQLTSNVSDLEKHMNELSIHSTESAKSSILLPD